jgi:hypothetical protein
VSDLIWARVNTYNKHIVRYPDQAMSTFLNRPWMYNALQELFTKTAAIQFPDEPVCLYRWYSNLMQMPTERVKFLKAHTECTTQGCRVQILNVSIYILALRFYYVSGSKVGCFACRKGGWQHLAVDRCTTSMKSMRPLTNVSNETPINQPI